VIGQQLSYSVFAYGHAGPLGSAIQSTAAEGLLEYDLMDGENERLLPMRIGSELWYATKIQERALFPLRAGKLVIEPMRVQFRGAGWVATSTATPSARANRSVSWFEPPLDGRPPGYRLGMSVSLRSVQPWSPGGDAQDAVAITLTSLRLGNCRRSWTCPRTKESMARTHHERIRRAQGGRIGGSAAGCTSSSSTSRQHRPRPCTLPYWTQSVHTTRSRPSSWARSESTERGSAHGARAERLRGGECGRTVGARAA
jgi:hypothetical protein